jgi:hypothetical protein
MLVEDVYGIPPSNSSENQTEGSRDNPQRPTSFTISMHAFLGHAWQWAMTDIGLRDSVTQGGERLHQVIKLTLRRHCPNFRQSPLKLVFEQLCGVKAAIIKLPPKPKFRLIGKKKPKSKIMSVKSPPLARVRG